MNSNLEKNWNEDQEMCETLNMGIVLEPNIPIGHWGSLVGVGVRKQMWTRGL
jgi:hypothetical protein